MIEPDKAEREIRRQKWGKTRISNIICPNCKASNLRRIWCKNCGLRFEKPFVYYEDPLLTLVQQEGK